MNWLSDHIQKILGTLSAVTGAVVSYAAVGGLNEIMGARELQILGLLNVIFGAATFARDSSNSAKLKVAEAMQTAINATPPPKQGGFARIGVLIALAALGALESSFQGPEADRIVQVNEFLRLVLSALPPAARPMMALTFLRDVSPPSRATRFARPSYVFQFGFSAASLCFPTRRTSSLP